MATGKSSSNYWHYHWLLETYHQISTPGTCTTKHLGISVLLHRIWSSQLGPFAPARIPSFISWRLDSLLSKRHSIPASFYKKEVATPEYITYNQVDTVQKSV